MLGVGRIHPRAQEPVSSTLDRIHAATEAEFLEKGYQSASIARAILKDAPIIILDEATASVDPENEHLIQQAISELTRGKTIITIAHRLATIEQVDQILVVEDGKIAERGTHQELIPQNAVYKPFTEIPERAEGLNLSQKSSHIITKPPDFRPVVLRSEIRYIGVSAR